MSSGIGLPPEPLDRRLWKLLAWSESQALKHPETTRVRLLSVHVLTVVFPFFSSGFFPKAWRRVLQRMWLSLKSRRYMDDVMDGLMDDARMDGVMDYLVGFPLKIHMFSSTGKGWREPPHLKKCKSDDPLRVLALSRRKNDDPLRVRGVS